MSFIGYHQKIYTATRNKTAIRDPNEHDNLL